MAYKTTETCLLCGAEAKTDRTVARLAPTERGGEITYSVIDRCIDRDKCRERCRAQGDPWIVIDPEDRASFERTASA